MDMLSPKLALADRPTIGEEVEDLELAWLEVVCGERVAQPPDGFLTHQRQHEAGAGAEFLEDAGSGLGGDGSHAQSVASIIVRA